MNKKQEPPWNNPRFRNWVAVARACQAVGRAMTQLLAPLDLKPAHLDLMMNIHRHPGSSQQDVANKLLVGRSNITMLLPQLEKRGLVRREPDTSDKRIMRLHMTEEGEAVLDQALGIYVPLIDRLMGPNSIDECNVVGQSMEKLLATLAEEQD